MTTRDEEIKRKYRDGASEADLANEFGLPRDWIRTIILGRKIR